MKIVKLMLFSGFLVTVMTSIVHAQFFEVCKTGCVDELIENIKAHSAHTYRRDYKFDHIRYLQTPELPPGVEPARLNDVLGFLDELNDLSKATRLRKAAVLFFAYSKGQLCTWLLPPSSGKFRSHVASMKEEELRSLRPNLMNALRVTGKVNNRLPVPRGVKLADVPAPTGDVKKVLTETSNRLLPGPISQGLLEEGIDTLVVVPISAIGTIPFAALPFRDQRLMDYVSVVVAPDFFAFQKRPMKAQHDFSNPIIIGDPEGEPDPKWEFPRLQGAREEAEAVAKDLKSHGLIGKEASKEKIKSRLRDQSKTGLVYLATHGIADEENPLDGSFLMLSDGRWTAREMGKVNLKGYRPLVVMSACQTGLGKDFDVGTIGMARAWQRAGASSVVMSLWNVDDTATRDLMVNFMRLATQKPPDKSLQEAMQVTRKDHPDPALWAGFSVFGAPEL